nr:reverse transcriptase domain-containing protein [Tanacetum cinerariifolium]GEZ32046.1 reverse transcriptase domain-containing protein [Tanacetum cinerariifolium]
MQNQLTNLTDLLTKFLNSNNSSTSSSGTLPSNVIANPRSDLKAITTRSGVSYDGPQIPPPTSFLPKSKSPILSSKPVNSPTIEPVASPVSASRPNLRPSIPYPSRMQDQKLRDKANDQRENIFQIFNDLNFNISFAEALILMPKFRPSIKILLTNKDKLCELARTPLNEHCLAVHLKKLPEKLEDPDKFLIPCDFLGKAECLALVDLGARINLMLLSVWNKLSLPDLTPTRMTLDLVDRLISRPIGVAEDVYVKVGSFHFSTDIVVVDFDADPRVPLILGRSFLKTRRALTRCIGKEAITFKVELKDLPPHLEYAFLEGDDKFPVIIAKYFSVEEKTALITVLKSHKRAIAWKLSNIKAKKGGFTVVENEDNELILTRLVMGWRICINYHKLNEGTRKDHFPLPFMDQMRKRLARNQYYWFLDGFFGYFQIPIDPKDQEKTTFTYPYERFVYRRMPFRLCNAPGTFQWCMMAIFHDIIEKAMEKDSMARLLRWVLLLQEFTFKVIDTKGAENLAADHLSRLENPHQNMLDPKEINESFPLGTLNFVSTRGENRASWSDKLDDALWAFRTAYKTPIGCTTYKLVYRKACHLPIEMEHKAY